jgi:hypothetical protein
VHTDEEGVERCGRVGEGVGLGHFEGRMCAVMVGERGSWAEVLCTVGLYVSGWIAIEIGKSTRDGLFASTRLSMYLA